MMTPEWIESFAEISQIGNWESSGGQEYFKVLPTIILSLYLRALQIPLICSSKINILSSDDNVTVMMTVAFDTTIIARTGEHDPYLGISDMKSLSLVF